MKSGLLCLAFWALFVSVLSAEKAATVVSDTENKPSEPIKPSEPPVEEPAVEAAEPPSETVETAIEIPSEPVDKDIVKARVVISDLTTFYRQQEWSDYQGLTVNACPSELKRIHQARTFAAQDLPFFHNVEYKNTDVVGTFPDLLLLNAADQVVERIELTRMSRAEINQLLMRKGFFKKSHKDQLVPEMYRTGPYVEREEL